MKSPQDMRIIQIDITNACMYQCSNCTRFCGHHKKNFFMDFETFKRAVHSLEGYHGTIGMMGGEPTLHPEFERFAKYLNSKMTGEYAKKYQSLIRPQKDFIESVLLENEEESEVYHYHTGDRETNVGAGLWSAMVPTYKKYYETIQDTFKMQAVNDHGNIMYHSPILINRKDLGIPDEKWHEIRDHCWAQDIWSATITPKGAFFCEIAGALDMLFDGPGGWPIEKGWWKRTPDQFGDQLKWCELCGIAIETFTRDANDWIDDVSDSMYQKLADIDSPKLKNHPERINRVKIEDGKIAKESMAGAREVRKSLFYDNFASRFNRGKSILYPDGFDLILDSDASREEYRTWLEKYRNIFKDVFICGLKETAGDDDWTDPDVHFVHFDGKWGHSFAYAVRHAEPMRPILYMDRLFQLDEEKLDDLKETVLNPGTLQISHLDRTATDYIADDVKDGIIALFHSNALSLKAVGNDFLENAGCFGEIADIWQKEKVIPFDSSQIEHHEDNRLRGGKRYAVYGAGIGGHDAIREILKLGSIIVCVCDSDCQKWNTEIEGIPVISPEELKGKKQNFDQIIIASTYYKQILQTLLDLGFTRQDCIVYS